MLYSFLLGQIFLVNLLHFWSMFRVKNVLTSHLIDSDGRAFHKDSKSGLKSKITKNTNMTFLPNTARLAFGLTRHSTSLLSRRVNYELATLFVPAFYVSIGERLRDMLCSENE